MGPRMVTNREAGAEPSWRNQLATIIWMHVIYHGTFSLTRKDEVWLYTGGVQRKTWHCSLYPVVIWPITHPWLSLGIQNWGDSCRDKSRTNCCSDSGCGYNTGQALHALCRCSTHNGNTRCAKRSMKEPTLNALQLDFNNHVQYSYAQWVPKMMKYGGSTWIRLSVINLT